MCQMQPMQLESVLSDVIISIGFIGTAILVIWLMPVTIHGTYMHMHIKYFSYMIYYQFGGHISF